MIVDDEINILKSMKRFLSKYGFRILIMESGEKALITLKTDIVNLMILDLKMPNMNGIEVLDHTKKYYPETKVIIQTGHGGVKDAVLAMKKGAYDFLVKGEPIEIIQKKIEKVYERWALEQENILLKNTKQYLFDFKELVGESHPMQVLKNLIARVAPTDTTVLIQGESGTGKELIAKALHYHSNRKNKPFIALDCAAISESLLESELFGHEKGAFTGAVNSSQGLVRAAHSGTLFLDEIGEISSQVQAKLLRTIQEKTVRPVGSTKTFQADVRIIAATNKNLLDMVTTSHFRQDLFYRLSTVTLTAPPLRERGDDIILLTNFILNQCKNFDDKTVRASKECIDMLMNYDWPGNVRELDNVLRGSALFSDNCNLQPHDLPEYMHISYKNYPSEPKKTSVAAFEKEAIVKALKVTNNNKKDAQKMLGISIATLYRKIKIYDLK
jgi:DNA-binding NtrC family response regulator